MVVLTKTDFIIYLKYLKIKLNENGSFDKLIDSIDECIKIESEYSPINYYYDDLLDIYSESVEKVINKYVIYWQNISLWKSYFRKTIIEKIKN